jgi:hypothetical protein
MQNCAPLSLAVLALLPVTAAAFPPYRSTDAETAASGVMEARVGLVRVRHDGDEERYAAPLLRLNLGLASNVEMTLESEYDLDGNRVGDGAIGLKLVIPSDLVSWGVETLALLPVNSTHSGVGVESQLLMTWRPAQMRVHLNGGGFYDPRSAGLERGWRASLLTEVEHRLGRPGLELFARGFKDGRTEVQLGAGWIVPLGSLQLRIGAHAGLAGNAPDFSASVWLSTDRRLWRDQRAASDHP